MQPPKSWSSIVGTNTTTPICAGKRPGAVPLLQSKEQEKSRQPSVHDKIREKMKEGIELTPEERDILRQKRRERRKREKELKKKEKENKVIQDIYKPRTTKLNFISGELLSKCKDVTSTGKSRMKDNKIKFLDEEYPDLARKKKVPPTVQILHTEIRDDKGRLLLSDKESNSEWETEEEYRELSDDLQQLDLKAEQLEEVKVEVVSDHNKNFSYSSILKSSKKTEQKIITIPKQPIETPDCPTGTKKVKKKDPILFDISSALKVNNQRSKKVSGVVTGKLKKQTTSKSVRNQLDSTAPERKRGKEREGGKKKRKTLMKKIILADRERRREERLKSGAILKPLPLPPDEDIHQTADFKPIEAEEMEFSESSNQNKNIETQDELIELLIDSSGENKAVDSGKEKIELKENDTSVESKGQRNKIVSHNTTETEAEVVAKFIESSVEDKAKSNIHTRRFRTYCNHLLSADLDNTVAALMSDLIRFQDKVHARDPDRARAKRRYIVGLRECAKFLKVKKLSCIIFAPNIEKVEAEGGLDDTVSRLIAEAESLNVSVVFSLNRYKLGKLCYKKVAISCIGILNYQGSDVSRNVGESLIIEIIFCRKTTRVCWSKPAS